MNAFLKYIERTTWQAAAATFDDYNYRQVWAFGRACAARLGACCEHVAIGAADKILGLADVRIKRLPLVSAGIAYITGGPMVRQDGEADPQRLHTCLQTLITEYVERRGLTLRILAAPGEPQWKDAQTRVFEQLGFYPAEHWPGYRTMLVDTTRDEADIRKSLAQKWRNGLNRAEKNNLTVRSGTTHDLFQEFRTLFDQLIARKGFSVDLQPEFYQALQPDMLPEEQFIVSLADDAGHTVAGHVASILGDTAVYLLGATDQQGIQNKSSYLLQWHTIQMSCQRGCRWYDLGGIDPDANPGVYHFKQGLSGIDVSAAGPFERAPAGLRRHLVRTAEKMYRSAKRLRRG